jgi:hypothetical protein
MSLESFLSSSGVMTKQPRLVRKIVNKRNRKIVAHSSGERRTKVPLMADFETTTDEADCRVWSWGLVSLENPTYNAVEIGTDIDSFIMRAMEYNTTIYFHNLKFDGYFILDYLLKNGYLHVHTDFVKRVATFKTLINDMGNFYSINVKWPNGNICEFRDSFKKLPFSVKRIAESWGLEDSKGTLDYDSHNGPITPITAEEEDYLRRDVTIVAQALKILYDEKHTKLTSGSDALSEYKAIVGAEWFKRMFPTFTLAMDAEIRRAYRGGFTYREPRFKGFNNKTGIVLDVNSLYPSVMMNNILPYGEPVYVAGECKPTKERPLAIFSVTFTAKLKKNHIPCIQIKGHSLFSATEYLTDIDEPVTLMVTNIDWILYQNHYDIDILEYGGGWLFHATTGLFADYINKWSKIKAESKGARRELAKLFLNALYGKFASNPNVTGKFPKLIDDQVKLIRGQEEMRAPVYTAVGVFVTSWARDLTIRAAQNNYSCFAYADTDSLHLFMDKAPDTIEVHPTKLGAWKLEYNFNAAHYIRAKAYVERTTYCSVDLYKIKNKIPHDYSEGDYITHIAGLPPVVTENMTFDDLIDGKVLHGKLNPKIVSGGIVLKNIEFRLKL